MNINYNLHKYIGYVLAPIRLILLILLYVIYILLLPLLKFIKQKNINEFTTYWNNTVIFILGLSINIEGKENISNKTKIIISNHIHTYDTHIMLNIFNKVLSYIANEDYYIFPFKYLFDYTKCILCNKYKKSGVVGKIIEHVKHNDLVIYPDACNEIPIDCNIALFKNGAFIPKKPIQPIVIRYVPSSNNKLNYKNDITFGQHLLYSLIDGHLEIFVKILPLEEYKEEYNGFEDYKDVIYKKMSDELDKLPNQYPPRLINKECSNNITMLFVLLSFLLCLFISIKDVSHYHL